MKQVRNIAGEPGVAQLDLRTAELLEGNRRAYQVRCRIPFTFDGFGAIALNATAAPAATAVDPSATRAEDDASAGMGLRVVEGLASSTSLDWYGTEMSKGCLDDMAIQMTAGVSYVPTHRDAEWDHVFGRTFEASVVPATVRNPYDASEQGYVLRSKSRVDTKYPRAQDLCQRLAKGEQIGQSIGGWFTEIRMITGDDGWVERMIVEKVELDHLAVTRRPGNGDCDDLALRDMQVAVEQAIAEAHRAAPDTTAPRFKEPMAQRAVQVDDADGRVVVTYQRAQRSVPALIQAEAAVDPITSTGNPTPAAEVRDAASPATDPTTATPPGATQGEPAADQGRAQPAPQAGAAGQATDPVPPTAPAVDATPEADGRASAPDAVTTNKEVTMTPEQLAALMGTMEKLSKSVDALAERAQAPAPAPAPTQAAPATQQDERDRRLAELEARNAQHEATIGRLVRTPAAARRSVHAGAHAGQLPTENEWQHLSRRAKESEMVALSSLMDESFAKRIAGDGRYSHTGLEGGQARTALMDDLVTFLSAAEADGALDTYFGHVN